MSDAIDQQYFEETQYSAQQFSSEELCSRVAMSMDLQV